MEYNYEIDILLKFSTMLLVYFALYAALLSFNTQPGRNQKASNKKKVFFTLKQYVLDIFF